MGTKTIIGIAVVGLIFIGGYFLLSSSPAPSAPSPAPAPTPSPAPSPTPAPSTTAPSEKVVALTASGFSPSSLTISVGTAVKFLNTDSVPHWPASGVHPTHQVCPGFDALKPLAPGESYSFTFGTAKTCPAHDHLNPGARGTIVVQ